MAVAIATSYVGVEPAAGECGGLGAAVERQQQRTTWVGSGGRASPAGEGTERP